MSTAQEVINEKNAAKKEINKSIRDLVSLKISLPLGNPNLKMVHTNQFLFFDLPDEFELANMDVISQAMTGNETRYVGYQKGRWYIEGVTITNDGDKATMNLELNPFPSSLDNYREDYLKFVSNYTKAEEEKRKANEKTTTSKTVKSVPSVNTTLKGGEGKIIDDAVKKWVGSKTNDLDKAKAVHEGLIKSKIYYKFYYNSIHKTPEKCWNNRKSGLNCGDTAILTTSCMRSAGLNAWIAFRCDGNHFFTVIKINGKEYYSDITNGDNKAGDRKWNSVWQNNKKWCRNYGNRIK